MALPEVTAFPVSPASRYRPARRRHLRTSSSRQKEAQVSLPPPNRALLSTPEPSSHRPCALKPLRRCVDGVKVSSGSRPSSSQQPFRHFAGGGLSPLFPSPSQGDEMQVGNVGGGDKEGGQSSPAGDKMQVSVNDLSSDAFKKAWLTLKELHDKELRRLQGKLTSLRKERLADRRQLGSRAKIKELMEQRNILNVTINDLQHKLRSKVCDRCSVNEIYRKMLQKEYDHIQKQNMKLIAELTEERNKLKEENKRLYARLKLKEQQLYPSSSDSDDDFIPRTQKTGLVFSVRNPPPTFQIHPPFRPVTQSNTEQMKSGDKKEQQQSSELPIPFYSKDPSVVPEVVPESPLESSSNNSKPPTGRSASQKSPASLPLTSAPGASAPGAQGEHAFQGDFSRPEDRLGSTQKKPIFTQKSSTQKRRAQSCFSWSPSSVSAGENPPTPLVPATADPPTPLAPETADPPTPLAPATSDEYTLDTLDDANLFRLTQRKGRPPSYLFPFDYTSCGKRSATRLSQQKTGFSVRESCSQTPSNEEVTVRKHTAESTGAAGADKPQGETQISTLGSTIKRKARVQPGRRK